MPGAHDLQEGWKLEVINPRTFASLHPATVTKVIDELYFIVTLDDLSPNHEEVQFCCHGASPGIFPICWSMYKGLKLVPPKGLCRSSSTCILFTLEIHPILCRLDQA